MLDTCPADATLRYMASTGASAGQGVVAGPHTGGRDHDPRTGLDRLACTEPIVNPVDSLPLDRRGECGSKSRWERSTGHLRSHRAPPHDNADQQPDEYRTGARS